MLEPRRCHVASPPPSVCIVSGIWSSRKGYVGLCQRFNGFDGMLVGGSNSVMDKVPEPDDEGGAKDTLLQDDWLRDGRTEPAGSLRAAISNAMVGLKKAYYGKGPVKAKTYINDNIIFCVLQGGLTRNEETLLAVGEEALIRQFRLRFQEAMSAPTTKAVEELTGRNVLAYHSQIVFHPDHSFEIFVLDGPPLEERGAMDRRWG